MNNYNWKERIADICKSFPESARCPVIGITGNFGDKGCELAVGYYKSVIRAGGIPIIIPPSDDKDVIINTLDKIDGLILSGGGDADPRYFGEEPSPLLHTISKERDLPEILTIQLAYHRQIPILGICRGIQMMVSVLGGSIHQDIGHIEGVLQHSQEQERDKTSHSVNLKKDSILYSLYNKEKIEVNSFHHQAVKEVGDKFRIIGTSSDGVIEAVESTEHKPMIGVQWHPECLESGAPIFKWFVEQASLFQQTKETHRHILTLDSHCDTPMFFPQGIDFGSRDSKILVDLHKMDEGRQDATIMVAYLPQNGEYGKEYADSIFDKIEDIQKKNSDFIGIARTSTELYINKAEGKKSIMLGIENGKALEGDINNIKHFADRGVVYITLCHNGDNDICDSAKGATTHNGISRFGQDVIREMNRLGIIVDISHASEKSFYDALRMSETPIVCSHSSCRALCDHPRNLTDDQMKALAEAGGVMQITAYHGFLKKDGEATIMTLLEHLEHAIKIMGIDHVGLGTDFDGDGGIKGLANSSELLNFTRHLLARRYSLEDIEKIWGRNFLRVMDEVQARV
ncbi:MAG: gamma-glutamyl-gamma-aminobutyrate hydrolase family protein [Bacteroidaceae bacterium]|nr:gamma-glutamyl-gamma-aminobutyrate hydrolase family protein [Bacteroidaceae bacterium]